MKITWKQIIIAFAIAVILAYILGHCVGVRSVMKRVGSDTAVRKDSSVTVFPFLVPYFVRYDSVEIVGVSNTITHTVYDTLYGAGKEVEVLPQWAKDTLKEYWATRYYSDTQTISRGKAIIQTSVNRNRLRPLTLKLYNSDSIITNTITLQPPKKFVGYFTLSAMGNGQRGVYGIGTGMALKTPGDNIYQGEVKLVQGQRPIYEGRVFLPLRFKKKK